MSFSTWSRARQSVLAKTKPLPSQPSSPIARRRFLPDLADQDQRHRQPTVLAASQSVRSMFSAAQAAEQVEARPIELKAD
jgi:hypothetical protein